MIFFKEYQFVPPVIWKAIHTIRMASIFFLLTNSKTELKVNKRSYVCRSIVSKGKFAINQLPLFKTWCSVDRRQKRLSVWTEELNSDQFSSIIRAVHYLWWDLCNPWIYSIYASLIYKEKYEWNFRESTYLSIWKLRNISLNCHHLAAYITNVD